MDAPAIPSVEETEQYHRCLRKYRHANILTAIHHAREIDDGEVVIYGCGFCGGSHVGHTAAAVYTKLKRTIARLNRAREALRTNNGSGGQRTRHALEDSIRDLTARKLEFEGEASKGIGVPQSAIPRVADSWGLASIVLINIGIWLQHLGCDYAARSKRPW